ncbi:MAG: DNA replication/repair protein RecF [Culturomica sp.]|jgi:DNA replication and repair protein RecF|nr:DNA replication/repair protein RecF [Culturomica sp.]
MIIKELNILNFKNLAEVQLFFCRGFNCFIGNNGAGKTNILDAIYQLSMCKSYFNLSDVQNIRHDEAFFVLKAIYEKDEEEICVHCGVKRGQKKVIKKNQKPYEKFSDHIGLLPLVIISPEDSLLIEGGSEERRKLIDGIISQYDRDYLYSLISYNRALQHRNTLLRQATERPIDADVMEIWDEKLVAEGARIMQARHAFIEKFGEIFQSYYDRISAGKETVGMVYNPSIKEEDYLSGLKRNFEKDRILAYTSAGVHRDDILLTIDGYPVKKTGSQGQKKTFLIALKMAQYTRLQEISGVKPLLLLDDIFDKLDAERVSRIIGIVGEGAFGQTFITDTNRLHIDELLKSQDNEYAIFTVENGIVIK